MSPLPRIYVHADESCLGNQFRARANPGGAGGLMEFWRDQQWTRRDYWVAEGDTTNNRMALRSAIEGLRLLRERCDVSFVSDSQYLVRGMTEWLPGWKARGWKRKGGAIENLELWQELDGVAAEHRVRWRWTRGHVGHPENEYANHLATRAARTLESSDGAVDSDFLRWLEEQREKRGHYLDYHEFLPPEERWPGDDGL